MPFVVESQYLMSLQRLVTLLASLSCGIVVMAIFHSEFGYKDGETADREIIEK